jgi:hypothetical protein
MRKTWNLNYLSQLELRVMLTSNIWTDAGLINGALGVVEKIVYNPGILPPNHPHMF